MTNSEVVKILREMAAYWEMEGVDFKPRAYEKAASGIAALDTNIADLYAGGGLKGLTQIPGVGKGIAVHIEELLKTGHFKEYDHFKKRIPVQITELLGIGGIGPRMIKVLWEKLRITNLQDLEAAAQAGKIRELPHFGQKSEEKILRGIQFLQKSSGRQILGYLLPEVRSIEKTVQSFPEVLRAAIAGSIRRRKETIGDIDLLVVSKKPENAIERFLSLPWIEHVYAKGPTKISVKLKNGSDMDLRIVPGKSFGSALLYFTGSKDHNIALREISIKKGWKLNEYGLFEGNRSIAAKTEQEIYHALGLQYVEPEMREDCGEIEVAFAKRLPKLIEYDALKGDLQVQTNWTDGEDTIEAMALEAERLGLEYIAITDHTKSLAMTRGSDEIKLLEQMAAIDKINKQLKADGHRIRLLKGAEVNIMKDGTLDVRDDILEKLDVVGVAVHHYFGLSREEQTARVIRAIRNPHADILFHPTSRKINRRDPIQLDMDQVIEAAKQTGTVLEIDSYPDRLDLKDEYIRKCVHAGVKMCIDSDAHSTSHLRFLEFGIAQARRGWAKKKDIVNTLPREAFLDTLKH